VRPFIKYHAVQAIALNIVLWVIMIILSITVIGAICAPIVWLVTLWPAIDSYAATTPRSRSSATSSRNRLGVNFSCPPPPYGGGGFRSME